jgi:hypothetical protein
LDLAENERKLEAEKHNGEVKVAQVVSIERFPCAPFKGGGYETTMRTLGESTNCPSWERGIEPKGDCVTCDTRRTLHTGSGVCESRRS